MKKFKEYLNNYNILINRKKELLEELDKNDIDLINELINREIDLITKQLKILEEQNLYTESEVNNIKSWN